MQGTFKEKASRLDTPSKAPLKIHLFFEILHSEVIKELCMETRHLVGMGDEHQYLHEILYDALFTMHCQYSDLLPNPESPNILLTGDKKRH